LLAVVACAFYVGLRLSDNAEKTVESSMGIATETVITGEIIREGLADIGELATQEYYFTEVESYDSQKKVNDFKIPLTTSRFVYSYDGMIKAGIDFTGIQVEKDDLKKLIMVKLPKAKILSVEIYEDSFKVYDEKQSIFNQVSISDFNNTNANLKARAEERAIERGLLDKANDNAVLLLKNFLLSTYDVSDYAIKVETQE
jgi:hypothetical protein